jgi:hypothetical protein
VTVNPANISPAAGQLKLANWRMDVDSALLTSPTLSAAQASSLADTAYHEGRHAEQWYAAAQSQAAASPNPATSGPAVATSLGMPASVGNAAAANPRPANSSPNAVLGQAVAGSVVTRGAQRNATLRAVLADPTNPTKYARYQALPEEKDAFRTGDATGGCP